MGFEHLVRKRIERGRRQKKLPGQKRAPMVFKLGGSRMEAYPPEYDIKSQESCGRKGLEEGPFPERKRGKEKVVGNTNRRNEGKKRTSRTKNARRYMVQEASREKEFATTRRGRAEI